MKITIEVPNNIILLIAAAQEASKEQLQKIIGDKGETPLEIGPEEVEAIGKEGEQGLHLLLGAVAVEKLKNQISK